jgi:hypothetical protein
MWIWRGPYGADKNTFHTQIKGHSMIIHVSAIREDLQAVRDYLTYTLMEVSKCATKSEFIDQILDMDGEYQGLFWAEQKGASSLAPEHENYSKHMKQLESMRSSIPRVLLLEGGFPSQQKAHKGGQTKVKKEVEKKTAGWRLGGAVKVEDEKKEGQKKTYDAKDGDAVKVEDEKKEGQEKTDDAKDGDAVEGEEEKKEGEKKTDEEKDAGAMKVEDQKKEGEKTAGVKTIKSEAQAQGLEPFFS